MGSDDISGIHRIIGDLTGRKPYIFVIMSYNTHWHLFSLIRGLVEDSTGLACVRADDIPGAGHDLLAKIHAAIDRAELIIAEISNTSPNVFYEIGYAVGVNKPILLLIDDKLEVPTDLKGREFITYGGSREKMEIFERKFREHLQSNLNSQVALLRDMLVADLPKPAYIAISPKYPKKGEKSPIPGQEYDYRTFGDHMGVIGIISAFGRIFGEDSGVELVSAQYSPPDFLERSQNLYLIGSPKVNPWVKPLMHMMQKNKVPLWRFGAEPGQEEINNYRVALYQNIDGNEVMIEGETKPGGPEGHVIQTMDHGLILRGPHPYHPDRIVLIMAGPHILGTGAACLTATRSQLIKEINKKLPIGIDISNKRETFWVLVRGKISARDKLLDVEDVEIVDAGIYK